MTTTTDPVIFQPYTKQQSPKDFYYKAVLSNDEDSTHAIFLYTIGHETTKEPRRRWLLIDLIEHKISEDREENSSIIKHTQALDSMHEVLIYVEDMYNSVVRFKDLIMED